MISNGENTPNPGILVHVWAIFRSKTSIFRLVDANEPPCDLHLDGGTPLFMTIFNAVFAITRGKDEIKISRKRFKAAQAVLFWQNKP